MLPTAILNGTMKRLDSPCPRPAYCRTLYDLLFMSTVQSTCEQGIAVHTCEPRSCESDVGGLQENQHQFRLCFEREMKPNNINFKINI